MDWGREYNADVVNAILLSNKLERVYLCLLKQHNAISAKTDRERERDSKCFACQLRAV